MSNKLYIFIITAFFLISGSHVNGQDNRTLDTKIADILAQIPAEDANHRDMLSNEMIKMGEEGIMAFCELLVAPGTGDDTQARYALESLSKYVSGRVKESDRKLCSNTYIKAIEKENVWEVKDFLIRQLQFCAKDEAVPILKLYLKHRMLSYPAARTLILIGSDMAEKALISTLTKNISADPKIMLEVIKAMGAMRSKSSISFIHKISESSNKNIRKVSLEALAQIADPSSLKILSSAAKDAGYLFEYTKATASYIEFANNLYKNGDSKTSLKICNKLIKSCKDFNQLHVNLAAIELIVKIKADEAMPYLLKAVDHNDFKYRGAALRFAQDIKSEEATRMWLEKLEKIDPETKVEIIDMLGNRGDLQAVSEIKLLLNDENHNIRLSAVNALSLLMGQKAMTILVQHLLNHPNDNIKLQLLNVTGENNISELTKIINVAPVSTKALIIEIISERKATAYYENIFNYCSDNSEIVKNSALTALNNLVTANTEIIGLMSLMQKLNEQKNIKKVQSAVIKTANLQKDKGFQIETLYEVGGDEARIIEMLPEIGGAKALEKIIYSYNNGNNNMRAVAFNALTRWKDFSASDALYDIISNSDNKEYKKAAFKGYVNQISKARIYDDQKLLLLRKVMPFASDAIDKNLLIRSAGKIKTFLSLVFVDNYIQESDVQQTAARAAMGIAMPSNGLDNGFTGPVVEKILNKVYDVLKGAESEYEKENILSYNNETRTESGFVSMFNGKDLTGWQGLVENPISRAKMSKHELAAKQKIADEKVLENWSVKDGSIWFNGKGNNLCSVRDYSDFELIVDWRITKKGDSGIYLRGTPQVQIWDTSRVEVGAQVGSGGLYNNAKHMSKPLKVADNPIGDWNTFRITMIGEQVSVYLNGELMVDNVIMENYWDRNIPIFESGAIELQAHGSDLAFRNIYVKEIIVPKYEISQEEKDEGFTVLFNGKDLNGWVGNKTDYVVEDGNIAIYPKRGGKGNLYTEKEYDDFNYRFDFQLTPGANNGLGIRAPLEGDAAYVGMELQILDNTASIYANLEQYQYHGSVYGVIPSKRGFLKPIGEWNSQEVIANGSKIKIILNGTVIVDGDIKEASKNGTIDHKDHPGLLREKGHIGFLGHGSTLKFRNIRIKEL